VSKTLSLLTASVLLFVGASGIAQAQNLRIRPLKTIYVDAKGSAMRIPQGVTYDGVSQLVVSDTGNRRLLVFSLTDDAAVPTFEMRLREVTYPTRVKFEPSGTILVLDGKSHRIARVTTGGEFQGYVELASDGGQDPVIKSFDVDSEGNLWVLDVANGRIVVVGPDGDSSRTIATPAEARFLSDLTVSSSGAVFVVDSVGRRVFVARKGDPAASALGDGLEEDVEFPTCIVVDSASGVLFIADQYGGGIVVLGQDGSFHGRQSSMGWKKGYLRYPSDLSAAGGYLFVADRENNRVQWFEVVQ